MGVLSSISRFGLYEPFNLQVSRGQITGHVRFCPFGFNSAVGTSPETMWTAGATYSYPSTATALTVVSSSTDDDGSPAGTGARTVTIIGLDANYNEVSETVTMNGTTNVTTTQTFLRVNEAIVATAGSTGSNVGTITIANTTPVTLAEIVATAGIAQQCVYTVPAGKSVYITRYMVSSYNSTSTGSAAQIWFKPYGGANMLATTVRIPGTGAFTCEADYPFPVTEKTDIEMRGVTYSGSANMSGQIQIVVIQNNG